MRIKKLEIVGFKSFCDRAVVRFDAPITGIVGPNGCGKSNVVDAIRWCMGEQSAKHLRGKSMEDVIFAGSDRRGPLGYCEVSMTFENDGRLPVEYLGYSEVTVTRRLFRDGTSEYYLNKTPCRLRDISELFLGTGIGTRAYSIIEQGRVGMIVSSKPEDRRFLIEEAAGITKYKLRKKAAEKKLDATRQNLVRVSDIVAEQERQLASLKRQAEKAERYKRYRAELRDIELWGLSQRWLGLVAEERVYRDLCNAASATQQAAETARQAMEAELASIRLEMSEEEARLQEMQERLYALDNQVKLGEAENEHARKEESRLLAEAQKLRAEQEVLHQRGEQATAENTRVQEELSALSSQGEGLDDRLREGEEKLKAARERLAEFARTSDGIKSDIAQQNAEIARGEAAERSMARQLDDLDQRLMRSEDEETRLASRKAELETEISSQQERLGGLHEARVNLARTRQDAEERLKDLKLLVTRLEKDVDHVKSELNKKKARHHSLSEIAARHEGFSLGTRLLLQRDKQAGKPGKDDGSDEKSPKTLADLIIAPAELEVAIDAVLGDRLGALLCETQGEAAESVGYLRNRGEGRATLIPQDARPPRPSDRPPRPDGEDSLNLGVRGRLIDLIQCPPGYQGVLDAALGRVLVLDTLDHALAYYQQASDDGSLSPGALLCTLDGSVVDGHGAVTGGAQRGQGASVLAHQRELRELQVQIKELDERFRSEEEQLVVSKKEREHLLGKMEELTKAGHQGEMQILSLDKDLIKAREELHRTAHRLDVLGSERMLLSEQRATLDRDAEESRLATRAARDRLAQLEDQLDTHSRAQVDLMDQVETQSSTLTQLKVSAATYKEKLSSLRSAAARLESEQSERTQRLMRLAEEERSCYQKAAALANEVQHRGSDLLERAAGRTRLAEELQVLRNGYEQKRSRSAEREADLRGRRDKESAEVKRAMALRTRLSELELGRQHAEQTMQEKHRVLVSEVVTDYHLRPPISAKDEDRASELRDLIDRMGEINLMAIEEYKEVEKRYNFLVAQRTDLETAVGQLEKAIELINKTSRQRFREVFDLVNAKFQEIFPRCFLGGQAYLRLSYPKDTAKDAAKDGESAEGAPRSAALSPTKRDPEDILEAGVEIFAQPPGKKNATVELLSGGEKAMTAVALIFAIFLIKPSPFCLLDEVDAPLDEANVGRFNDLIRSMTDRSQFILITHNKRTMQIADVLYGVTMDEPGVSRVVSVNMHEVGRLAPGRKATRAA
ncbi:MAG: chromosome segregation protein SMC [Myxococcales bacterium]|nr:chromosome segregation protein SMC [Myxococcales bacterium]